MSLGYRVFFIYNDEVQRIAQKRFNSLYLDNPESFPKYAGQTVISVLVVYELVSRKPDRIIRIETQKIRFDERRWNQRHPELSKLQLEKIMIGVFGSSV